MDHSDQYFVESAEREPWRAMFGRLLWMVLGPIVLLVLTILIVVRGTGWFTPEDWCFFTTMGVMIWGRWLEIRTGYGRTALCYHATPLHFRRYVTKFIPWALLVWTTANIVGNHLLHTL